MAEATNNPITLDLSVQEQSINVDVESIAPVQGFTVDSFDVANSTITATVINPTGADKEYRLVIHADVEAGTSATARIVSVSEANNKTFKNVINFRRIVKRDSSLIEPVLQKAGIAIDTNLPKQQQLDELAKHFKIADITVPAGTHVMRIHVSQVLRQVSGNPKSYRLDMYAPLLCFAPTSNVRLSATLVFPLDFQVKATIRQVDYKPLPGYSTPNLIAGGNTQVIVGQQIAYGWLFQTIDPIISAEYTYN